MIQTRQSPDAARDVGRVAIRAFLGLLVVNALVAIAAIIGASGDHEWEILGTTLLLTAGCLTVAANAGAIEIGRLGWLPYIGALLSCVAFTVFIVMIWNEPSSDADWIWKPTLIALTLGLAATYASMLSTPLTGAFPVAQRVGYGTVGLLAAITSGAILAEEGGSVEMYAVLSVILATASIIVLVGAIVARRTSKQPAAVHEPSPQLASGLLCPRCGATVAPALVSGRHRCPACNLDFGLQL